MQMNLAEYRLCPKCGSTDFFEKYPSPGTTTCGKCGCRIIKIALTEMTEDKVLEQNCSHCGAEGEEDDTLLDKGSILVFKCKKCGTIDGYFITEIFDDSAYDDYENFHDDGDYDWKTRKIVEDEGTRNIPSAEKCKAFAKALKKKEKNPKEQNKKHLWQITRNKTPELQKIGITNQTIRDANLTVELYLRHKAAVTQKQLTFLFAASILLSEERQISRGYISTSHSTERNIAEVFSVDRKTLRKWKKIVDKT